MLDLSIFSCSIPTEEPPDAVSRRRPVPERIPSVYISAKVDYAIRALCGLADSQRSMTSAALAAEQNLPENSWKAF